MGNSPAKKKPSKIGFQKINPSQNNGRIVDIETDEDDDSGKGNSPKREDELTSPSLSNHSVRQMNIGEMKVLVEELLKKNQRLTGEHKNMEGELRTRQEEITALRSNKEDASKKITELQLELGHFLQDCKSEVQQLEERLKEKHAEEMTESRSHIEELISSNQKQSGEIEELRKRCEDLETRVQNGADNVSEVASITNSNSHPIHRPPVKKTNKSNSKGQQWKI